MHVPKTTLTRSSIREQAYQAIASIPHGSSHSPYYSCSGPPDSRLHLPCPTLSNLAYTHKSTILSSGTSSIRTKSTVRVAEKGGWPQNGYTQKVWLGGGLWARRLVCIVGCLSVALPNYCRARYQKVASGRCGLRLWSSILLCSGGEATRVRLHGSVCQLAQDLQCKEPDRCGTRSPSSQAHLRCRQDTSILEILLDKQLGHEVHYVRPTKPLTLPGHPNGRQQN